MKKLFILLLLIVTAMTVQAQGVISPFDQIRIKQNQKKNTATRVLVQDSITNNVGWVLKSTMSGATPTLNQVLTAGNTSSSAINLTGGSATHQSNGNFGSRTNSSTPSINSYWFPDTYQLNNGSNFLNITTGTIQKGTGTFSTTLNWTTPTANRNQYFPNKSGTFLVDTDLNLNEVLAGGNFSTHNLNLGTLSVNSIQMNAPTGEIGITNPLNTDMVTLFTPLETVYQRLDQNEYLTIGAYGLQKNIGGFNYGLGFTTPTADRTQIFPDKSGTFAMTSDISGYTGFVPYTGATSNLDMTNRNIKADNFIAQESGNEMKFGYISTFGGNLFGLQNTGNDAALVTADYDNNIYTFGNFGLVHDAGNSRFDFSNGSVYFNNNGVFNDTFTQFDGTYDGGQWVMDTDQSWGMVDVDSGNDVWKFDKTTGDFNFGPTNIYAHGNKMLTVLDKDSTVIDGSTNLPTGDAVSDALKIKTDGPNSATDNRLVRFDGSSGKVVQNSGWTLNDDDTMTVVGMGQNQLLGVAASGVKTEFKYLVGTAGHISVTHAPNGITLDLSNCVKNTTDTSGLTGTTTETIMTSLAVPAGMFSSGDIMRIASFDEKLLANGTNLIKYYLNTTNSLSGATLIYQYSSAAGNKSLGTSREYFLKPSNLVYGHSATANNLLTTDTATANTPLSATFTYTGAFFVIKTFTLSNGTDNAIGKSFRVEKL